ncbi:hypothetical protein J437_LFUL016276 [Ladona fulva]|uniref:Uncharacterized protein n=1 Tax=Ladona fulva TaxID=123851 RepID=A0A8K0P9W3_LADFU|nr:hypothetical protein J437_LFUL016276 [Ladona fulva]
MYFNATDNGCKMWILTVLAVLSLYESVKRLVRLALLGRLRLIMAFLFLLSLFSHYYSWWGFINYWNDEFYTQWYHQLFFTITELFSTVIILYLANMDNFVSLRAALLVSGVGFLHSIAASYDQFIVNVVQGKGQAHQVVRDVCLMVPDLFQFILPLMMIFRASLKKRHSISGYATAIGEHMSELVALAMLIFIGIIIILLL